MICEIEVFEKNKQKHKCINCEKLKIGNLSTSKKQTTPEFNPVTFQNVNTHFRTEDIHDN